MCSKCDRVEEKFGWQATQEAFLDGFIRPLVVEKKRAGITLSFFESEF